MYILFQATDITQHALEVLATSKIREVHLVGRRGPLQAAFTIKELREILKLEGCATCMNPTEFNGISDVLSKLERPRKRITELMLKHANEDPKTDSPKSFKPQFFRSPLRITADEVLLGVNVLDESSRPVLTSQTEVLKCDLPIASIGYKSVQADSDIPFDKDRGVCRNVRGKVADGLYAAGWLATGPRGVIINTMNNAFSVAEMICSDAKTLCSESRGGYKYVASELTKGNVQPVLWEDWLRIDAYEQEQGRKSGKPREKVVSISEMLRLVS